MKLQNFTNDTIKELFFKSLPTDILINTPLSENNYEIFTKNYLGQLLNHHAFTNIDFSCVIGIYESIDDASFYITILKYNNDSAIKYVFDEVLKFCFSRGRMRFFICLPKNYNHIDSLLLASPDNYDFYTEFIVLAKEKCKYSFPWQILYYRQLSDIDTKVICFTLKEKLRNDINGGFK